MMIEAGKSQGVRFTRNLGYHHLGMNLIELEQWDKGGGNIDRIRRCIIE